MHGGRGEAAPTPEKTPELRENPQITGHTRCSAKLVRKDTTGCILVIKTKLMKL